MYMNYDTTKQMVKTVCEILYKGITPSECTKCHSGMYEINKRIESSWYFVAQIYEKFIYQFMKKLMHYSKQ